MRSPLPSILLGALLSGLTLAGWITGMQVLASIRTNYIPMAPSTALCFAIVAADMTSLDGENGLCTS